jgi:hypothetical protein
MTRVQRAPMQAYIGRTLQESRDNQVQNRRSLDAALKKRPLRLRIGQQVRISSVAGGGTLSKTSGSGADDSGHGDDVELGPGDREPRKKTAIPFLLRALGDPALGHHGAKHVGGPADDPETRPLDF